MADPTTTNSSLALADPLVIDPTLTVAGQAAAINASNTGIELIITHASFGRGHYDPTGNELALVDPVGSRIPLAGGSRPTPYQLRMVCSWDENVGTVAIGEIGFWSNNILVFVWSKADGTLAAYKTDGVTYVLFNDLMFAQVPANSINFVIDPNESAALAALAAHEGASNAHPQYQLIASEATEAEMSGAVQTSGTNWVSVRRLLNSFNTAYNKSVLYTTTAPVALTGLGVQTGGDWAAALPLGARVLAKNQASGKDNGLYSAAAGAWTRVADADSSDEVLPGLLVNVDKGTTLANTRWRLSTLAPIVLGTTALTFQDFGSGYAPIDYVEKAIIEALAKLDHKESVQYTTTASVTLSGLGVQAGGDWPVALVAGARVLVKNQGVAQNNGLYSAAAGSWVRTVDADGSVEVTSGMVVAVEQGTTFADTRWQLVTDGAVVLGTTALTFQLASNPTATTAPQFDDSKAVATTEFARRMGLQYSSSGVNTGGSAYSMNASHIGGVLQIYGSSSFAITLPPLDGVPNGATVTLTGAMNAGKKATLVAPTGKALRHVSGANMADPVTLWQDEVAVFQAYGNGGEWRLIGGSLMLRYAASSPDANFITLPQFDLSQGLSTTEFVQRALGNRRGATAISASRAITAADFGCEIVVHALTGITLTLPGLASVPHGASVRLVNLGQAPCTFVAAAGESFNGAFDLSATATSFVLQVGDEVSITDFASHWMVIGSGSVRNSYGTDYGSRDLGGGLVLQWGKILCPPNPTNDRYDFDVAFPRAFPNQCFGVVGSPGVAAIDLDTADSMGNLYRSSRSDALTGIPTNVGFEAAVFYAANTADARIYTWYALGN